MSKFKNFRHAIFSRQKGELYKSVTFLGLTIKIKRKNKKPLRETIKAVSVQDAYNLEPLRSAQCLVVFLVPFNDKNSDDLLDIFRLCRQTRALKKDFCCLISTMPGPFTYAVNENQDDEPVHRWEQIMENCGGVEKLYVHLPDYCASNFYGSLKKHEIELLQSLPKLHLNILCQHQELMPSFETLKVWTSLTANISQSTSVASYSSQDVCERIGLPMYCFSPYLTVDPHPQKDFENKSKTILYSPDNHPMKDRVLQRLRESLPDYELREVQHLPNDNFLKTLAEARFCLNFGLNANSYYIQPFFSRSIGLTIYNENFFDDHAVRFFPFVYDSYYHLAENLADDIKRVCRTRDEYERISADMSGYFNSRVTKQYGLDAFYRGEPALVPWLSINPPIEKEVFNPDDYSVEATHSKKDRLGSRPLLTVIVFTYNHRSCIAKCLESLVNQKTDYQYELHVWDDCSIDGTSDICVRYARKYPDLIKLVVQKENTFTKADLKLQSYSAIMQIDSKYFCYIDGDDYWCDNNKVQIALDFLESHPEYIGFAHDTLQINKYDKTCLSYIHEVQQYEFENPVTLSAESPFFLGCSRLFRTCDFVEKRLLPIDYKQYYYHLALGPIYYYDRIMACYVIGENNTFANLNGRKIKNLNSMFAYYLARMFDFQQDDFCTAMQKNYDLIQNNLGSHRYNRLRRLKKLLGTKLGWNLWFFITFVPRFGLACLGDNYIYSRKAAKKRADKRIT